VSSERGFPGRGPRTHGLRGCGLVGRASCSSLCGRPLNRVGVGRRLHQPPIYWTNAEAETVAIPARPHLQLRRFTSEIGARLVGRKAGAHSTPRGEVNFSTSPCPTPLVT
jgi:hypothetical protein